MLFWQISLPTVRIVAKVNEMHIPYTDTHTYIVLGNISINEHEVASKAHTWDTVLHLYLSLSTDGIEYNRLWQLQQPKLITVGHDSQNGSSYYCRTWKPQQSTIKTRTVHIRFEEDKEKLTHVFLSVLQPSHHKHFTNPPYLHFFHLPVILYDLSDWARH